MSNHFGNAIRLGREKRCMTLRELGKMTHIDHGYIHRMENGKRCNPSVEVIRTLCTTLFLDVRDTLQLLYLDLGNRRLKEMNLDER